MAKAKANKVTEKKEVTETFVEKKERETFEKLQSDAISKLWKNKKQIDNSVNSRR